MTPTLSEVLRRSRPFVHLSRHARGELLREYGMHSHVPENRSGTDAFEVREDIEVGDAFETATRLLRGVVAMLEMLEVAPDVPRIHRDVCGACASLGRQADGALAVIAAVLYPGNGPGADRNFATQAEWTAATGGNQTLFP